MVSSEDRDERQRGSGGLLRVPFIRRCALGFDDGRTASAFIVNINVLGAYLAWDDLTRPGTGAPAGPSECAARDDKPRLGQAVSCRFRIPGKDEEIQLEGVVSWLNERQQHPLHSLPPGFGMKFHELSAEHRAYLTALVDDYVARQGHGR